MQNVVFGPPSFPGTRGLIKQSILPFSKVRIPKMQVSLVYYLHAESS